ncbi:MAG: hypothetical protein PHU23_16180 [Dehalococcoidales bacterium]|nr:hypothetical protein [Dehalococcoidales bacterium]
MEAQGPLHSFTIMTDFSGIRNIVMPEPDNGVSLEASTGEAEAFQSGEIISH